MLHETTFNATLLQQRSVTVCYTRRFLTQHENFGNNGADFFENCFKNFQPVAPTKCCVKTGPVRHVTTPHWLSMYCIKSARLTSIGPLHDQVTWYKITHACEYAKLHSGTSKTMQLVPVHLYLLCFGSPTAQLAHRHVWFCTMWPDLANYLLLYSI